MAKQAKDRLISSTAGGLLIGLTTAFINPGVHFWIGFATAAILGFTSLVRVGLKPINDPCRIVHRKNCYDNVGIHDR